MEETLIGLLVGAAAIAFGAWSIYKQRLSLNLRDRDDFERRAGETMRDVRARQDRWVFELRGNAARTAGTGMVIGGAAIMMATIGGGMVALFIIGLLTMVVLVMVGAAMQVMTVMRGMPDRINENMERAQDMAAQMQEQMRQDSQS